MNKLSNFKDKDPPWFNKLIKSFIQERKDAFKQYSKQLIKHLHFLQEKLNSFISVSKQNY